VTGRLPRDHVAPRRARALLAPLETGASRERFDVLRLLVTELVANCVAHGGETGEIDVHARRDDVSGTIHAEVVSAAGATRPHLATGRLAGEGGLGLRIVDRHAARWGVSDAGERVGVWFDLGERATAHR
jgi:anti-sigma regulatory factor (Ser/Thr protein kinase)